MKTIRTASFDKLSKEKVCDPKDMKDAKRPKDYRSTWDSDSDFSDRLDEEFNGDAKRKKDDALDDKWNQLFNKDKKRQPAYASKR